METSTLGYPSRKTNCTTESRSTTGSINELISGSKQSVCTILRSGKGRRRREYASRHTCGASETAPGDEAGEWGGRRGGGRRRREQTRCHGFDSFGFSPDFDSPTWALGGDWRGLFWRLLVLGSRILRGLGWAGPSVSKGSVDRGQKMLWSSADFFLVIQKFQYSLRIQIVVFTLDMDVFLTKIHPDTK
jgi:hypothetical protein